MKDPSPSALVSCRHEAANPRFGFRLSDLASSFLLLVAMPGAPSSDALALSSVLPVCLFFSESSEFSPFVLREQKHGSTARRRASLTLIQGGHCVGWFKLVLTPRICCPSEQALFRNCFTSPEVGNIISSDIRPKLMPLM